MYLYFNITIKLIVGAIGVLIVLRTIGKKAISELTPFDLVYLLVLGGLMEGSILHHETTVFQLVFSIALWGVIVYIFEVVLKKTRKLSKVLQGEPAVLISDGKLNLQALKNNHVDLEQLRAMLRQHGCYRFEEVKYAILEINGGLSVIKQTEDDVPSVLIVDNGKADPETLKYIDRSEEWLHQKLKEIDAPPLKELVYCEWLPGDQLSYSTYSEAIRVREHLDG